MTPPALSLPSSARRGNRIGVATLLASPLAGRGEGRGGRMQFLSPPAQKSQAEPGRGETADVPILGRPLPQRHVRPTPA